ncbi:MAG: hypothetical protein AAGF56_01095 [Pseudomonadota bacterium]
MTRRSLFLPFVALLVFVAYLGLRSGQLPTETEIINRYAATYLTTAPDGAELTDCAAAPHPDDRIRMVITCAHPLGLTTTFFVGPRGEAVEPPDGPSA